MQVFGLSSGGESQGAVEEFAETFQLTFPVLTNASSTYGVYRQSGGISPYPLDYVIDQAGNVAYFSTEYDPEAMIAVIDELLADPAPVDDVPAVAALSLEARPNPFNPRTEITFDPGAAGPVRLDIHDARGHRVRQLLNTWVEDGGRSVTWNGLDDAGRSMPSGTYLARLRSTSGQVTRKLTLMR